MQPDLPSDVRVVSIDCGGNHNLALTAKGEVYSWAVEYAKVEKCKCKSQQFASSLHVCANTEGMIRAVLNKNHFTVVLKNSLHFTSLPTLFVLMDVLCA